MKNRYKVIIETVNRNMTVYVSAANKTDARRKALIEAKVGDYLSIRVLDN